MYSGDTIKLAMRRSRTGVILVTHTHSKERIVWEKPRGVIGIDEEKAGPEWREKARPPLEI